MFPPRLEKVELKQIYAAHVGQDMCLRDCIKVYLLWQNYAVILDHVVRLDLMHEALYVFKSNSRKYPFEDCFGSAIFLHFNVDFEFPTFPPGVFVQIYEDVWNHYTENMGTEDPVDIPTTIVTVPNISDSDTDTSTDECKGESLF